MALRMSLEYLALSLEANDAKDLSVMVPKVQAFHQAMISYGKKLHGQAGEMLMRPHQWRRRRGPPRQPPWMCAW